MILETTQDQSMKMLKQAKKLAKDGHYNQAWDIVKNDTMLTKGTTKETYIDWLKKLN